MDNDRQTRLFFVVSRLLATIIVAWIMVTVVWSILQGTINRTNSFIFVVFVAGVLLLAFGIINIASAASKAAEQERQKIEEAASKVEKEPEKVRPVWEFARITLDSYFNRNLGQITYIFWFSVFVMVVGFGVIIWGIVQAIKTPNTIAPAMIAVLAGVVTEFLGATFIFIYRATIQQALNYTKTLERINSVGMAMQILDTMPDTTQEDDLKSKTKAVLVELLVRQANETSTEKGA